MGKKGGGAGDEPPRSDTTKPSTTQQTKSESTSHTKLPHQEEEQQHSEPLTSATTDSALQTQLESSESDQLSRQRTSTPSRHQVIAVSASKGPAAFFNLARKFLVTDEFCDLSALEGAIVSAVDAAHLLERSKLANIVRIQTSYVPVEPKRRPHQESSKQSTDMTSSAVATTSAASNIPTPELHKEDQPTTTTSRRGHQGRKGAPLRRSRIIITVKRTDDYKQWLEENPHHAAGHGDDIDDSPT